MNTTIAIAKGGEDSVTCLLRPLYTVRKIAIAKGGRTVCHILATPSTSILFEIWKQLVQEGGTYLARNQTYTVAPAPTVIGAGYMHIAHTAQIQIICGTVQYIPFSKHPQDELFCIFQKLSYYKQSKVSINFYTMMWIRTDPHSGSAFWIWIRKKYTDPDPGDKK